jgi:hypothetical protein
MKQEWVFPSAVGGNGVVCNVDADLSDEKGPNWPLMNLGRHGKMISELLVARLVIKMNGCDGITRARISVRIIYEPV